MTLRELYESIDGNYDQAIKVLRVEKLIDKHIRRLPGNAIFSEIAEAGKSMDPTRMFDSAHAMKGVCSNLGLTRLAALSEELCEEFRPGNPRKLSDADVKERIAEIGRLFQKAADGISKYSQQ